MGAAAAFTMTFTHEKQPERRPCIYTVSRFNEPRRSFEHALITESGYALCTWESENENPTENEAIGALRNEFRLHPSSRAQSQ